MNKENNEKHEDVYSNEEEKKVIIYLIITALILLFIASIFIHYIVDRGSVHKTDIGTIDKPTITNDVDDGSRRKNNDEVFPRVPDLPDSGETQAEDEEVIIDYSDRIRVKQNGVDFKYIKELDIFKNSFYNNRAIIAPGVHGTYSFTVENESDVDFIYDIFFTEQNIHNVNMIYKIKLNGQYIVGSKDEWIKHQNFSKLKLPIGAGATDIYTIEWKWEDTDYDTQIGENYGAYYKMNIHVDAEQVVK